MNPIEDQTPLQYPIPVRIARVLLVDDWYACSGANGTFLNYVVGNTQDDLENNPGRQLVNSQDPLWLYDPSGVINGMLLATEDADGVLRLSAGTPVTCWQPIDSLDGHWEPLAAGALCSVGSGSEGSEEEGSEGSESSEESSGGPECPFPVTGEAANLPGYNPTIKQGLGHDEHGCWEWQDNCCAECPADWTGCLDQISAALSGPGGICYDLTGVTLEFNAAGYAIDTDPPNMANPCSSVEGWLTCSGGDVTIRIVTTDCSGASDHICTWLSHPRPLVDGCPPLGGWTLFPDETCSCRDNITLTLG